MAKKYDPATENGHDDFVQPVKVQGPFDLSYLLPRLLVRWHWIAIGTLLGVVFGIINIRLSTPIYQSQAKVRLKSQNLGVTGRGSTGDELNLEDAASIEAIRNDFNQPDLFQELAEDQGIRSLPNLVPPPKRGISSLWKVQQKRSTETSHLDEAPPVDKLAGMIHGWTSTEHQQGTRFIAIKVKHTDQDVAQDIANKVVKFYMARRKETKSGSLGERSETLENERKKVEANLQKAKQTRAAYTRVMKTEADLTKAEKELRVEKTLTKHKHPRMKKATAELKRSKEAFLLELERLSGNPLDAEAWEPHLKSFENTEDDDTIADLRTFLQVRVATIDTDIKTTDSTLTGLKEKVDVTKIDQGNTEAEVVFTDPAQRPGAPTSPNRKSILVKNTVLGLFGGLLVAFAFQYFDNKFHGVAELEQAFDVPVLSAIQHLPDERELAEQKAHLRHLPPSLHRISPTLAVPGFETDCVHSEMFRVLRASMSLLGDATQRRITLISSSLPGEGKTFVAANLAVAYAKQGTRTLIVDMDLRKPALHKIFGEGRSDRPGIVNVLNGTAAASQAVANYPGLDNLSVIFSGPQTPNPGELLEPNRVRSLLNMFASNFDHLIIDSAPLLPVPDTRLLVPMVDNFGLVARADHTPIKAVQSTLNLLADDGMRPSGIILNDFSEAKMQGGKYGYGYGYGKYGEDLD